MKKLKIDPQIIFYGVLVSTLLIIGFIFFDLFSISVDGIILYSASLPGKFVSTDFLTPLKDISLDFLSFIVPFIPISLSISVLSVFGAKFGENRKLGLVSTIVPSFIGLIILGISFLSVMLFLGIVISGLLSTGLSEMYSKELKKWKNYRIGSNAAKKCFFILNILILVGVFLTIIYNTSYYEEGLKSKTKEVVLGFMPEMSGQTSLPKEFESLPPSQKQLIEEEYNKSLKEQQSLINSKIDEMFSSKNFTGLMYFSLFTIPFIIFGVLEFLRSVVFSPIAGLVTKISLKEIGTK